MPFAHNKPRKNMTSTIHRPGFGRLLALSCIGLASLLSTAVSAQEAFPIAKATVLPTNDAFYVAPNASALASANPGDVLRYRPIPLGAYGSLAKEGYQLMYRSTGQQGQATAVITTVLIPSNAPALGRKVFSYQSFYDSLTINCTPSYLTVKGTLFEESNVDPALKAGHVVVLSDYEGLQSQWIANKNTAHGVLDGVRAAIKFNKTGLSANAAIGMMGFSGGGHATGWAAEMAPTYAPELNIVGAALGGVPANVGNVARKVDGTLFAGVYLAAVVGLSRAYPEIDPVKYATPAGLTAIEDIGNRCLLGMFQGQPEILWRYAGKKSTVYLKDANFLDLPEIAAIISENNMGSRIPKTPLYVYQGTLDEIMPIKDVDDLVKTYCDAGAKVQYHRAISDHLLMAISPGGARGYVLDRLAGKAAPSNCK
jgi:hypothetical protein